jgi:hypothetical protein
MSSWSWRMGVREGVRHRHDRGGREKVKGRKSLKNTYVNTLDVSRVRMELRRGARRKSSARESVRGVGHCPGVGRREEWGDERRPGAAGSRPLPRCSPERRKSLNHSHDQPTGNSGKLRSGCAESRIDLYVEMVFIGVWSGRNPRSPEARPYPPMHRCTGTTHSDIAVRCACPSGPPHERSQLPPRCPVSNWNDERATCRFVSC